MGIQDSIIRVGGDIAQFAQTNPEITAAVIALVVIFIRSRYNGRWPMLGSLRRGVLPYVAIWMENTKFSKVFEVTRKIRKEEKVGTYNITPSGINRVFRSHRNIYPDNVAKLKWRMHNNHKQFEFASWAYRPEGFLGLFQIHLIVFDNENGSIDLYAHFEFNPYARPIRHYLGGGEFSAKKGVEQAKEIMKSITHKQ